MKKITYICDVCGKEVTEDKVTELRGHDLCEVCADRAWELVTDWIMKKKTKPEKEPDWGKAQALRDRGWSINAIAKEIGVSWGQVDKNTKEPDKTKTKKYELEFNADGPAILKSPELI